MPDNDIDLIERFHGQIEKDDVPPIISDERYSDMCRQAVVGHADAPFTETEDEMATITHLKGIILGAYGREVDKNIRPVEGKTGYLRSSHSFERDTLRRVVSNLVDAPR